jgi:hypothetical protein
MVDGKAFFVWIDYFGKKSFEFKPNGSIAMRDVDKGSPFSSKKEAQAAMDATQSALLRKIDAELQAARAANPGKAISVQAVGQRHRSALLRLGQAKLLEMEPQSAAAVGLESAAQPLWGVVLSDGRWMRLVSGMCGAGTKEEAAFFLHRDDALSWAQSDGWTRAAEPLRDSACLVEVELRLKSSEPVFKNGGPNDFASAWRAAEEQRELAQAASAAREGAPSGQAADEPSGKGKAPRL